MIITYRYTTMHQFLPNSSRITGPAITQIVRGETTPLSDEETAEVLHSRLSYYPNDLLVVSWTAALVYDTAESSAPTIQLLEYANSQLLEFRHYDHVLTRLLAHVYDAVKAAPAFWGAGVWLAKPSV